MPLLVETLPDVERWGRDSRYNYIDEPKWSGESMQATQGRLQRDLETNAQFGALDGVDGHGRTVLTGTDANRDAREQLVDRFEDAGLTVTVDTVGTIVGRWTPDSADPSAAPVATGSHLDSVPVGGIFDGPLGVYGGLEAVRTLQQTDCEPVRPIDVVCFTEEEGGRFGNGLLGSSVSTGRLDVEEALVFEDESGTTLESVASGWIKVETRTLASRLTTASRRTAIDTDEKPGSPSQRFYLARE